MPPSIKDLTVTRLDSETLEVSSSLTRGRCATVYMFGFSNGRKTIVPFLIPSYMQGIGTTLISEAVDAFLEREKDNETS